MSNPIDEAIGIQSTEEDVEDAIVNIEIPNDADLDDVTKLALQSYKEQMENLQHIDAKYHARMLEVAALYLNIAKESLAKKTELNQKQKKLDKELGDNIPKEPVGKVSKKELYEKTKAIH